MICYPVILIYPVSVKRTSYREISFPPLMKEHEKELEVLRNMKDVGDHLSNPKGLQTFS